MKANQEVVVASNFKQNRASDSEIDSVEEIWNSIRYLDPDRQVANGDIVLGVIWTLAFVLFGVFIFLLHH